MHMKNDLGSLLVSTAAAAYLTTGGIDATLSRGAQLRLGRLARIARKMRRNRSGTVGLGKIPYVDKEHVITIVQIYLSANTTI
jgi:hypothetical protein